MKNILILAQFTQLPGENGNNRGRFKLISEMLSKSNYKVTVVTSKFRELDRTHRKWEKEFDAAPYEVVLLDELGYTENISFKRIFSMQTFTWNLERYLNEYGSKFDIIYACVPGLDSALIAGKFAKKKKIPFIIDVQDIWPEAMYDLVLDIPIISKIIFYPMQRMANKVYELADGIMAVSKTYLDVAIKKNKKSQFNNFVYIGTNLDEFDKSIINSSIGDLVSKSKDEYWISYIGSIGHSYDLKTFLNATQQANLEGLNVKPIIIGTGPLESEIKEYAVSIGSEAIFTGWVDHRTMGLYLKQSDAVINAIKKKAPQSITNKIGDYLSIGRPVLNGSLNSEFKSLLKEYNFGINYDPENTSSLKSAIFSLFSLSDEVRNELGKNARKLAEEKFDRNKTYKIIMDMIAKF